MHMALDHWLLEQHRLGQGRPLLRFYHWQPAAISLGYHQRRWPERWRSLSHALPHPASGNSPQPLAIVRRPTGGRAVLHQGDLTYSLIASGFIGSRAQVYRQVCEFLIQGWASLGVPLGFGQAGRGYIHNPDCFGTATAADLVTPGGAKLIGSAQLWRAGHLLQQGSMRLNPDPALLQQVFGQVDALPQLPPGLTEGQIIAALTTAAGACFQVEFAERQLTSGELAAVAALADSFRLPLGSESESLIKP
ncbi:MAG: lipoate--protein ligase family protein [Synechococcales cyanobacterium RM1_1_8]|nr:lipoate--protein ligase family protein [Synechococcales cyanobacterium RM1_1_8]